MSFARATIEALLARRTAAGVWEGKLSSSALSTATAILALASDPASQALINGGRDWLERTQNADGGWGDTTLSLSNISTTALCWAAIPNARGTAAKRAEDWLRKAAGSVDPPALAKAIADRYGKDRTFSVPILTALAIGGRLGSQPWKVVPALPFELAACPPRWFQWLKLPVVSYALPALIAIGLARHRRRPSRNPVARGTRGALTARVLRILEAIQPSNGGFLEATPLTSFVAMSLTAAGLGEHCVTAKCRAFLKASVRADGSWPIDTNLSTWLSTLAINAIPDSFSPEERAALRDWILDQQFATEHPYTHAAPGAWSWTNLPGAVPDADDTAGALIALHHLDPNGGRTRVAAEKGVRWLLDLQNRDGGMPTFCRGWGHLPFDRSGADLTAHTIRAWLAWKGLLPEQVSAAIERAVKYLQSVQRADGSFIPLWFGNQHAAAEENPVFGTSRVIPALIGAAPDSPMLANAIAWLENSQNPDGGWGGAPGVPSSIEETALAAGALALAHKNVGKAVDWLAEHTEQGTQFPPSPIGFYFASLWYFEDLYPLLFSASALYQVSETECNIRIPRTSSSSSN